MNLLTTGANGFIGRALCDKLSPDHKVIGIDIAERPDKPSKIAWEQASITDNDSVAAICDKYAPDVVIHCAGIAHQKMGSVDRETYIKVNSEATENLAKAAARTNPELLFVFLSSISVYGEGPQITQIRGNLISLKGQNHCDFQPTIFRFNPFLSALLSQSRLFNFFRSSSSQRNSLRSTLTCIPQDKFFSGVLKRIGFTPLEPSLLPFQSDCQPKSPDTKFHFACM